MATPLHGKVAIITGGSRGIGRAIALELATRGANVLITYASARSAADEVGQEVEALGVEFLAVAAAGSDPGAPKAIVDAAVKKWNVIDIIVNSAATGGNFGLLETTEDIFMEQVTVNLRFPLFLIKAAVPHFGVAPRIVNMSSIYARSGHADVLVYSACKGAMESATRCLARELGHKYHATVNCINPGPVNTDLWAKTIADPEAKEFWDAPVRETPAAPRVAEPHDVAHVVAFLCEERTKWTTGSVVNVNGGMLFV
ncbi:gluconate 5-dehydrogenase [Aaosphaeria arxii CBS 175.79]|uniref:Gluconate 5-dehydrogenase n=1 Tax=Aaosphaeria arxii CBS 175.79 TaxID=1450172 RepID=A0A6A5XXR7_9PLEO|nr:gluconate 5-dehydrogenase [Aaosphaeria arxii CBS 175.79]KAF2017952.1 gluconate 5-dehydrogenase [Aaosphaeria arxii CBS 175.79]